MADRRVRLAVGAAEALALVAWLLVDGGPKKFATFLILGLVTGAIYSIAASGLVVTYTTSGVFNVAHGALGMLMAFLYWELDVHAGLPAVLAFVLVVFIAAPLSGAVIERVFIRRIESQSVTTKLVVTIALLVLMLGFAQVTWKPTTARTVSPFFSGSAIDLFGVRVTGHELVTLVSSLLSALFLYWVLTRTRLGVAMRAVVDDRNLASLNGARPGRVSSLSWAVGSGLAGLAGVLLASIVQLNVLVLTLLVVNAFAAAVAGRLRSLPMTFAGAFGLGLLVEFYKGYQPRSILGRPVDGSLAEIADGLGAALPVVFLFVALLVLPSARLRAGRLTTGQLPRVPSLPTAALAGVAVIGVAWIVSRSLAIPDLARLGTGIGLALVMLSLVPLTGWAGQLSLGQLTFAGLGAFAMGKVGGDGNILGLGAAVLLAAAVGCLVALPSLRLQGLYLALSTLAFAVAMDNLFFARSYGFGFGGSLRIGRLDLFGFSFDGERTYFVFLTAVFVLAALALLVLRRSKFGRRLIAIRDSPAACATLGLNLTTTKLAVFGLSAGLAGLAGALLAGLTGAAGPTDFRMEQSLIVLLLAVIGGIATGSGPLLAGLLYAGLLAVWPDGLGVIIGGGALLLGRFPNGLASILPALLGVSREEGTSSVQPCPVVRRRVRPWARAAVGVGGDS